MQDDLQSQQPAAQSESVSAQHDTAAQAAQGARAAGEWLMQSSCYVLLHANLPTPLQLVVMSLVPNVAMGRLLQAMRVRGEASLASSTMMTWMLMMMLSLARHLADRHMLRVDSQHGI
jgi:hypothetical protein